MQELHTCISRLWGYCLTKKEIRCARHPVDYQSDEFKGSVEDSFRVSPECNSHGNAPMHAVASHRYSRDGTDPRVRLPPTVPLAFGAYRGTKFSKSRLSHHESASRPERC